MLRKFIGTLTSLFLCLSFAASALGQDETFWNLTLTDNTGSTPQLLFRAGQSNSQPYAIRGTNNGLFFTNPAQTSAVMGILDDATPAQVYMGPNGTGFGTTTPEAPMHLRGGIGVPFAPYQDPYLLIENTGVVGADRSLIVLENNGGAAVSFTNLQTSYNWRSGQMTNGPFQVSLVGTGGPEFRIMPNGRVLIGPGSANVFDLQPNGNLSIDGALTESSDRNKKENFGEVDSQKILKKLVELPISTWNYKSDDDSTRHLGPMAQDFYASFELGKNETTIARIDTAGVTIASIQALHQNNRELESRLAQLSKNNDSLLREVEELRQDMRLLLEEFQALQEK